MVGFGSKDGVLLGHMRRRDFLRFLGAPVAWPLTTRAQQLERVRRVGVLLAAYTETDRAGQVRIATFRDTLQGLGWNDDRNIHFDYRWGGNTANVKSLAAELLQSAPDAVLVAGDPALAQLSKLPSTIPIVFTQVSEPVDSGFIPSLARPGGHYHRFPEFRTCDGWQVAERPHGDCSKRKARWSDVQFGCCTSCIILARYRSRRAVTWSLD